MSAKEAAPFGKTNLPVTVHLPTGPKRGTGRTVTGDDLNDAIMDFVREDKGLWQVLAVPNSPTKASLPVTIVRITFNEPTSN